MVAYPSRHVASLIATLAFLMPQAAPAVPDPSARQQPADAQDRPIAIAIHGGAGTIRRQDMTPELDRQYREALEAALKIGHGILERGGTSLEAVEATIVYLEDSPLFNAGKGAVLTNEGRAELDASVMEGHTLRAGAVASVTSIKNPIKAAIAVMNQTPHVLLMGKGAEKFAAGAGLEAVENDYFITERRKRALEEVQKGEREQRSHVLTIGEGREDGLGLPTASPGELEEKFGTVGCVALDRHGNLAAGTSTGGLTNKRFGRVGDTPIIGAGNYAENATCAVSGTGQGEFFIRLMIAGDVAMRMRYGGQSLDEASAAQMGRLSDMQAFGGLISMSPEGRPTFVFNTEGMYRAFIGTDGGLHVAIYSDEDDRIPGDHDSNGGTEWDAAFDQAEGSN